jgi:uncharacterized protein YndB with AHSA1/START domain
MRLDPETDLSFTRTLPVPRALVWECWTSEQHLPQFFVPKPHKVTACKLDLRAGGACSTTFEVEGNIVENNGVYLEVVPGRRLVFTDTYTEGWKPAAEPFMTAIIDLSDAPGGGTIYTATARHRTAEAAQQHKAMGFYEGWGIAADQLVAYIQTLKG